MSKASDEGNKSIRRRMSKRKVEFLEAFSKSLALVTSASRKVGITRSTFYRWYKTDQHFADQIDEVRELVKDSVEAKIISKINEGDTTMMIFYAKTRMKDRGYVERTEVTGKDGKDLINAKEVDTSKLTDEQRELLKQIGQDVLNQKE